jgi:hypothetical protein
MMDVNVSPMLLEIFSNEPAVTMMRFFFATQKATVREFLP